MRVISSYFLCLSFSPLLSLHSIQYLQPESLTTTKTHFFLFLKQSLVIWPFDSLFLSFFLFSFFSETFILSHFLWKICFSLLPWQWQSYHLLTQKPIFTHPSSPPYPPVSTIFVAVLLDHSHSLELETPSLSLALLHQSKLLFNPICSFSDIVVSL